GSEETAKGSRKKMLGRKRAGKQQQQDGNKKDQSCHYGILQDVSTPTIKEGEVIEEFRTRDEDLDTGIDDYPSYCDDDKKIHIDFLEDMDAYRYEGMGDVSKKDKKNGISYSYQKLKGFYKGVLNLGPDYIRNAKMEE
ncbi:hypothetical protein Tco_1460554, partial [Tanacetum coccineum]